MGKKGKRRRRISKTTGSGLKAGFHQKRWEEGFKKGN